MYFKNELFGLVRVPISEVPISEDLLYYKTGRDGVKWTSDSETA